MVEHIKGEALSEVLLEVRLEKVVPPSEEIPSVVDLDASQPGEVVLLISGSESIVDGGRHEDGGRTNGSSNELAVLACGGGQDSRV